MMDLAKRMAMTVKGQVTWADPERNNNAHCDACRHYIPDRDAKGWALEKGRCDLVRAMTGKKGVLFFGGKAYACAKLERVRP